MTISDFDATAWNNGAHHPTGAGYGIKLDAANRNRYFKREWKTVMLSLEGFGGIVEVNVDKHSFWGPDCRELISREIGTWLLESNRAPWHAGEPPKLRLEPIGEAQFRVRFA